MMVLDGTCHRTSERGSLGNVSKELTKTRYNSASPFSRVQINTNISEYQSVF